MKTRMIAAVAALALLAGCASGVKRASIAPPSQPSSTNTPSVPAAQPTPPAITQFSSLSISLTPAAKEKVIENLKFNQDELLSHVKRALEAKSMLVKDADKPLPRMEVVIKDMRVRSNFSAVMWGFMAGADSIDGDIVLSDPAGKELDRFEVSASYALGGLAGGQDSARMGWLYETFAEETIKELTKQTTASAPQK